MNNQKKSPKKERFQPQPLYIELYPPTIPDQLPQLPIQEKPKRGVEIIDIF